MSLTKVSYSMIDGASINVLDYGADPTGAQESTTAIQNAFDAAQANGQLVYLPAGTYLVGNLLFGSQNTSGASAAPLGLVGDGWGSILKAKTGLTGTLLQSWSMTGKSFSDFQIDTTGTAATPWDCEWKPGVGPSTQNKIARVRVVGGTASTLVNLKNLNDTYPDELSVVAQSASQCCIDMTQSGGLSSIQNSIWTIGYLKFGCQNGTITNCWGMGIEFAAGCLNYVHIDGCYLYGNTSKNYVMWSESFSAFQSVKALTSTATQFITAAPHNPSTYFNLNAYSTLDFNGCQFIGDGTTMFGPQTRSDSYASVKCMFRGGSVYGTLTINTPSGFIIEQEGLMNDSTGLNLPNKTSSTYASGGNSSNFNAGVYYTLISSGTLEEGFYLITFAWNHNGVGSPWLINASALVNIVANTTGSSAGTDISCSVGEHDLNLGTTVNFRLKNPGTGATASVQWKSSDNLNSPGLYTWTAVKLA